jgi:hypothetical protein
METNLSDFENEAPSRSSFLTVLCVLTFIGSGWAILSSIWTFTTASKSAVIISQTSHIQTDSTFKKDSIQIGNPHKTSKVFEGNIKVSLSKMFTKENLQKTAIGSFISALLTLLGALLMWRLNRRGFYLYIAGVLVGILSPLILYGHNLIAIGISSFSSFFGLLFIALYALNLKSMKQGNG